jgi:LacI family transcriptional regulator
MKKKVTIQDIADALDISRNTVSKAINNSEGLADATRERILRKAVEMGYKQFSYVSTFSDNAAFRQVTEERRDTPCFRGEIALLTTGFITPSHFASLMLDKFQREMAQLGYTLNTHRVTREDLRAGRLPITFFPERSSGIICFEIFDREYAEMLCRLEIPILFVDAPAGTGGYALAADHVRTILEMGLEHAMCD